MLVSAVISSAGRRNTESLVARFQAHTRSDLAVETTVVRSSAEATEVAREAATRADIVVAVGGDGTVADVATGLFNSAAALGIVPTGSTNITARSLGIPANPRRAVDLVMGLHALRAIDIGRSENRSFLHIAGAGIDAEMFSRTRSDWKRRVGWLAYLPPAISAASLPPSFVQLEIDGRHVEASSPLILIANSGSVIVPAFRVYPGIAPDDGWLDVLVFTPKTPADVAALVAQAGTGILDRSPLVMNWKAKHVRIDAKPPLPVQLDGDTRGFTPREYELVPRGISVVTPLGPRTGRDRTTEALLFDR